jgi:hypothetical protein
LISLSTHGGAVAARDGKPIGQAIDQESEVVGICQSVCIKILPVGVHQFGAWCHTFRCMFLLTFAAILILARATVAATRSKL